MNAMQESLDRRPEHLYPVAPNISGMVGENQQFAYDPDKALYMRTDDHTVRMGEWLAQCPDGSITLRRWQQWSQDAWKVRHGTPEASLRFVAKLYEEYDELGQEIHEVIRDGSVSAAQRQKIVSESGDILWCLSAVASNVDISIEESYREYLRDCSNGTRILVDGAFVAPSWRETAMAQVVTGRLLTDKDVDRFLAADYVPQPSPDMNLDPEDFEPQFPRDIMQDWILYRVLPYGLENLSHYYYQVNEDGTQREEAVPYTALDNAANTRRLIAETMIRTLHAAKVLTGATTGEIMRENYHKITGRVMANLVDKTDGERPSELR